MILGGIAQIIIIIKLLISQGSRTKRSLFTVGPWVDVTQQTIYEYIYTETRQLFNMTECSKS